MFPAHRHPDQAPPAPAETTLPGADITRPNCARVYDWLLGGKDSYAVDQQFARAALGVFPHLRVGARESREFLCRAAELLADVGYRQFVEIGTGFPDAPGFNLHDIVQSVDPTSRVVYVDHDPLVVLHARALLKGDWPGRTGYLQADLREPEKILRSEALRDTLDLTRPVVLSLVGILHHLPDSDDPYGAVATLLDGLPAGSALMLSHLSAEHNPAVTDLAAVYQAAGIPLQARTDVQISRFLAGLDVADPGIVCCHRWQPDPFTGITPPTDAQVSWYAAVGIPPESRYNPSMIDLRSGLFDPPWTPRPVTDREWELLHAQSDLRLPVMTPSARDWNPLPVSTAKTHPTPGGPRSHREQIHALAGS